MARHCDNCRFWLPATLIWDHDQTEGHGDCRRYPAIVQTIQDRGDLYGLEEYYSQPRTHSRDWCGEWRRRRRVLAFLLRLAGKLLKRKV